MKDHSKKRREEKKRKVRSNEGRVRVRAERRGKERKKSNKQQKSYYTGGEYMEIGKSKSKKKEETKHTARGGSSSRDLASIGLRTISGSIGGSCGGGNSWIRNLSAWDARVLSRGGERESVAIQPLWELVSEEGPAGDWRSVGHTSGGMLVVGDSVLEVSLHCRGKVGPVRNSGTRGWVN